tara:strand:- start:1784 stop:2494 length:711 start_codon:yes stop_codon:yes gene_type:complete
MEEFEGKEKEELIALKKEHEEFVYIVSHDLKTPMRAITNITNWIEEDLEGISNNEVLANFSMLKNRVGRLEMMMNALLELSRVNNFDNEVYEFNIPRMIADCIELTKDKAKAEFHLSYTIENENSNSLGKKLKKVLLNILDNAIRFHDKEKMNIFIEVYESTTDYEFTIRDDGPGIPEEVKEKIFNMFYTVSSKDVLETTGAGLTICNKIIKRVGGKIEYSPSMDRGSVFKFNWPK